MKRVEKIDKQGNIHPLQLQIDKIQFLLDKIFEGQLTTEEEKQKELIACFMTEVATLFIDSVVVLLKAFVPEQMHTKTTEYLFEKIAQGIMIKLHG